MPVILKNPRNPAQLPADVCNFCERPYRFCQCDEPMSGYRLTDYGRAVLFDAPDLHPTMCAACEKIEN